MIVRRIVDTSFGQIHVRIRHGRGHPLLLLHMSPQSSRMWLPLMSRLDREMIAPDRIGFGFSDPPTGDLDIPAYAASTLEALDVLGVEQFDVLGEHTGSVEAVEVAHQAPNRVTKIGLVALPAYTSHEIAERTEVRATPPPPPSEDGSHYQRIWERRLAYRDPPYDLDHLHELTIQELMSAGPYRAYRAVFAYPMRERLSSLNRPVVVFAPNDDLATQTTRAREFLPQGSTWIDLDDLGIDMWKQAPERLTGLVAEHLGGPQ